MKVRWWDWLIYKLFYWRWNKILKNRPDLVSIFVYCLTNGQLSIKEAKTNVK